MDLLKERVAQWARAEETLELVRAENARNVKTIDAVAALRTATTHAIENSKLKKSSGLVEQQIFFQRIAAR